MLGPFCQQRRATTLPPFVRACSCHFADPANDQTCSCPFARQIKDEMLTLPYGRFAGHSTATMLLTFCRFLQNNQRFYLFKHVRKAKLRLFCQAVQTQSSHDPMIPCTVEQADFVCRMYTCICMYQHTCIHEHSQREVMLKQTKINIP